MLPFQFDPADLAARVTSSFGQFWGKIGNIFSAIGHFISQFFTDFNDIADRVQEMHDTFDAAVQNIEKEIQEIKDFQFDVKWKTRVINVPIAAQQLQDLKTFVFETMKDKFIKVRDELKEFATIIKQETAKQDVGDPQNPSALSRATVTVHSVITEFSIVNTVLKDVMDLSGMFLELTQRLKTLDDLFLKQGNPRQRVTKPTTIRVGKLHR
jgi:hypothetical protein